MRRHALVALGILLAGCPCACALDPSLDVNQYAHTVWKLNEGFSKGVISSIAQTPDGYLWLGTEFGLLRFDGIQAVPWQSPPGDHLPSNDVRSLRVARDGTLWIGTYRGLVSLKDRKLSHYPDLNGLIVEWLLEDREGTVWVVAGWTLSQARLCSIQDGKTQCYGESGGAGSGVTSIYEDSGGNLWAGAMNGVWRWKPGPPKLYPIPGPAQRTFAITESDDGGILIARRAGVTKLRNGKFEPYPFPAGLQFLPGRLLRDRNGALWIGALSDQGLLHMHQRKTDLFTPADGVSGDLSGDNVRALFEDREGTIWVATSNGLDRFREFAVPTVSVQQGLSSRAVSSVVSGKDGSIWLGTPGGLNRWSEGQVTVYRKRRVRGGTSLGGLTAGQLAEPGSTIREVFQSGLPHDELESLFEDDHQNLWAASLGGLAFLRADRFITVGSVPPGNVLSITGDPDANVWISHDKGLFHLRGALLVECIAWANLGHGQPASALLHDATHGGLWMGFREGGAAFFKDGLIRASYAGAQGLAEGIVHSFYKDANNALWAATEGGLSRLKDGRVLTLTSQDGLPCNNVHWMMEDDFHSAWLYTACGLVRVARSDLDAWVSNTNQKIQVSVFTTSEGVRSHPTVSGYSPLVAKAADGRLWFTTSEGVSVIDPHHLHENKLPPLVRIERITADGKEYDPARGPLPPLVRDLTIDYTALSLVVPEKVQFRFKLEGQDKDWREVVNVRHVEYTNLAPRHYRFLVKACNNSGVWNEEGAALDFVIPPAWHQTNWFLALCVAAFLVLLWALYQYRLHQMARQFQMTLDTRVAERTRIARDLHDTLLQSFHGVLLFLQSGIHLMREHPSEGMKTLETAVEQAERAILEGREAVQGLRASTVERNDLALAIKTFGAELASADSNAHRPEFSVQVEGVARNLHPILRDEVFRIAGEAMRNAFRHADAKQIEVEIRYDERQLRVRIRDDGKGIDPKLLSGHGREGHFGLRGMRERAKLIGGKLTVWSELDSGTEVELSLPASRAYTAPHDGQRSWLAEKFAKFSGKDTELKS